MYIQFIFGFPTYTREAKWEDGEFQSQRTKNYNVVSEEERQI